MIVELNLPKNRHVSERPLHGYGSRAPLGASGAPAEIIGQGQHLLVAENADASVEQLELFYLKRMEPTGERVRNIQSFGD